MSVFTKIKNIKLSARKVIPIANKIRGLTIDKAMNILLFSNKKASYILKKSLKSVIANAEHNNAMNVDNLFIYRICINNGTTFKRLNMRAKGKSDKIKKRNCNIFIEVKEKF